MYFLIYFFSATPLFLTDETLDSCLLPCTNYPVALLLANNIKIKCWPTLSQKTQCPVRCSIVLRRRETWFGVRSHFSRSFKRTVCRGTKFWACLKRPTGSTSPQSSLTDATIIPAEVGFALRPSLLLFLGGCGEAFGGTGVKEASRIIGILTP